MSQPGTDGEPFARTPRPPYVAVIFTSTLSAQTQGYAEMAAAMERLASEQPGYLGIESAREAVGISVSYWADEASARAWKDVAAHRRAQQQGQQQWYDAYQVRVAVVTLDYGWPSEGSPNP